MYLNTKRYYKLNDQNGVPYLRECFDLSEKTLSTWETLKNTFKLCENIAQK